MINGEIRYNSWTCNNVNREWHDGCKIMSKPEIKWLEPLLQGWKAGTIPPGKTVHLKDLVSD